MSNAKKYDEIRTLRDGETEPCELEVVKFSLNGGQGPHLRFILFAKCGRGGDRQEPKVVVEIFKGLDALDGERWDIWRGGGAEMVEVLAHFYVELRKRFAGAAKNDTPVF